MNALRAEQDGQRLSSFKSKVSRREALLILRMIFGLILIGAPNAQGTEYSCTLLFAKSESSPLTFSTSITPKSTFALNEASREFVLRLTYLIKERRLLPSEVLQRIVNSDRPFNPLGERATTTALQPHQVALAQLLREDLQWEEIRHAAQALIIAMNENQERQAEAVHETRASLNPVFIKTLPSPIERIVHTATSQVLALTTKSDFAKGSTSVKAYDLQTDQQVLETSYAGTNTAQMFFELDEAGRSSLLVHEPSRNTLNAIDLQPAQMPSEPLTAELRLPKAFLNTLQSSKVKPAGFVEKDGQLRFVKYSEKAAYLFDGFNGVFSRSVPLPGLKDGLFTSTGTIGHSVYIAAQRGPTFLISPWESTPLKKFNQVSIFTAFSHKGQRYGLGEDLTVPKTSISTAYRLMNLEDGQVSEPFQIPTPSNNPYLLKTFEQDGVLFGLMVANRDVYLIDLLKGQIVRKKSEASPDPRLTFDWSSANAGQVVFNFKKKHYHLAILREGNKNSDTRLVILDALTFQPVGPSYKLKTLLSNVRLIEDNDSQINAVLNFQDQTSEMISLVSPI